MRKLFTCLAVLSAIVCSAASAQMLTITGHVLDASGNPLASGTVNFTPVSCKTGTPISFQMSGGQVMQRPVSATVTGGVFSFPLPDVSQTFPTNVGFKETAQDPATGQQLIGSGYGCIQPIANSYWCGATSCSLDNFHPNTAPLALTQTGPAGTNGTNGQNGPPGPPLNVRGAWSSGTAYAIGDAVAYGTQLWVSLVAGNIGNTPTSGANWQALSTSQASQLVGSTMLMPMGSKMIFLGDSICVGAYAGTNQNITSQLAGHPAFVNRVSIANYCVSGSAIAPGTPNATAPDMTTQYANQNVGAACSSATATAPVYLILQGSNNAAANYIPGLESYNQVTSLAAVGHAAGCTVVIWTVLPRATFQSFQEMQREEHNRLLVQNSVLSSNPTWYLFNAENLLGNPNPMPTAGGSGSYYQCDGVHPCTPGYSLLTQAFANFMLNLSYAPPTLFVAAPSYVQDNSGVNSGYTDIITCNTGSSKFVNLSSAMREGQRLVVTSNGGACGAYVQNGFDTVGGISAGSGTSHGPYVYSKGDSISYVFHYVGGPGIVHFTGTEVNGNTTITGIANTAGINVGMGIGGDGIPGQGPGFTDVVTAVTANSITISSAPYTSLTGANLVVFNHGDWQILSENLSKSFFSLSSPPANIGFGGTNGNGPYFVIQADGYNPPYIDCAGIDYANNDQSQRSLDTVTVINSSTTRACNIGGPGAPGFQVAASSNGTIHSTTAKLLPNGWHIMFSN